LKARRLLRGDRALARDGAISTACRLLAGLLAWAPGCSLLVPGEPTHVLCTAEGAVGPPACPAGTYCHGGACEEGPPSLGAPCGVDGACAAGDQCLQPPTEGVAAPEICSRPCCSSADCGAGTGLVCAALGPGKMCIPSGLLDLGELGTGFAGEPCESGSDCRSGLCSAAHGTCDDACCSDAECGLYETTCRYSGDGWTCQPSADPPKGAYLEPCKASEDCASGLCVKWPDDLTRCAKPCCSSDECGAAKIGSVIAPIRCVPYVRDAVTVHACAGVAEGEANRGVGEPCDGPGHCRGGRCIEAGPDGALICSDVCCVDADCGAPQLFACAPVLRDGATDGHALELQCVPR
jgi:hypothetical protein